MAKKVLKSSLLIVLVVLILTSGVLAASGGTGEWLYENSTQISNGLTYTNRISYNSSGERVETYALDVSNGSSVYPIIMSCDTIYGGMTITQMVQYAESLGYNILAAINTDFFSTSTKVPLGIVIENGEYKSSPSGENVLAFDSAGAYLVESPTISISLHNNGGGEYFDAETGSFVSNSGKSISVEHLNKTRNEGGGLYLYTAAFSTVSTRTSTPGWAVRMKVLNGSMSVSGTMSLQVEEIIPNGTSYEIGDDYVVLTASEAAGLSSVLEMFSVGDVVTLTTSCSDSRLVNAQWATGCGDILVSNGSVTDSSNWDSALFNRHPRTAVGIKSDGSIVCYVIDGRSDSYSNGARLSEIAADLLSMGCIYVVNLDGGGSSTMAVKLPGSNTCSIVNSPSDGYARSCGTYMLLVTDIVSNGVAQNLFLENDGIFVLAGSSVELKYLASDAASNAVAVPGDITAISVSGLGTISGSVYTAGVAAGDDRISLSSYTGASGYGTLHIITNADSMSVFDAETGKAPLLTNIDSGKTVDIDIELSKLSRTVYFNESVVTYEVVGDIGSITPDGVFTANGVPGASGSIRITAGGITKELEVTFERRFVDIDGHWAKEYIETLFEHGIVEGTGDLHYEPNTNISRGDFILMLWRTMGKPEPSALTTFVDVPSESYYADAIAWAQEIGIAQGVGDGYFHPKDSLVREQAFTLIHRLLTYTGVELPLADISVLSSFNDTAELSPYAIEPVASLISYGLIEGSGGYIYPKSEMTRAEMAKILALSMY